MSTGSDLTWIQGVRTLLQQGDYAEAIALTERALAEPGNETNGRLTQLHGLTLYAVSYTHLTLPTKA